jgi:hypothetical protein
MAEAHQAAVVALVLDVVDEALVVAALVAMSSSISMTA